MAPSACSHTHLGVEAVAPLAAAGTLSLIPLHLHLARHLRWLAGFVATRSVRSLCTIMRRRRPVSPNIRHVHPRLLLVVVVIVKVRSRSGTAWRPTLASPCPGVVRPIPIPITPAFRWSLPLRSSVPHRWTLLIITVPIEICPWIRLTTNQVGIRPSRLTAVVVDLGEVVLLRQVLEGKVLFEPI